MSWVQQQPVPPPPSSQPPQPTTSSTLLPSTGASMRSHVSSSATISSTLNTSTKPQPQNLAHTNNNQLSRHPWQQQHSSMMQPTPNPPVNNYNAAQMNKWPQQQQNNAGSSANMYQPIAGNNWMQTDISVPSSGIQQQTHLQQPPNQQHQLNQQHYQQNQSMQQQHQPLQQQHHQQQHQQTLQQQHQQNHQQQQQDLQQTSKFSYFSQAPQNDNNFMQQQANANVSAFSNYQQQPIAHPQPPTLSQQQQQPPPIQQPPIHPPSHHLLHSTHHVSQQQQEEQVQNIINNNDASKNDGWADWDWNENGVINTGIDAVEQLTTHAQLEQQSMTTQMDSQQQQQNHYNANFIEDSFRSESNDNWHWGSSNQTHANAVEQNLQPLPKAPAAVAPAAPSVAPSVTSAVPSVAPAIPLLGQAAPSVASTTLLNPTQSQQFQQPQVPTPIAQSSTITTQQHFAEFSVATAKPASLPLPAVAAAAELNLTANNLHARPETTSEHSINAFGAATPAASTTTTTSNIPNSVYVSQAKPVTKPSRQYASPPVTSPVTEVAELSALSPPHAFQNEINAEPTIAPVTNFSPHVESTANMPPHVAPAAGNLAPQVPLPPATTPLVPQPATTATIPTAAVQPPPAMTPPTAALIPPVGINNATAGNPFKRAGAAQHHRGTFIPTNSNNNAQPLAPMAAMNFVVPPPPADFATPMQQQPLIGENVEPDNSEILHENQEVIVPAAAEVPNLTLSHTTTAPAQLAPIQTPPNDERNQYLQTSHLSENLDEELNIEMDNFPPPGLSRLVLGQPEYEASQRMVTGTEQDMDNFNIDERHADGEDTSLEPIVPAMANNTAANVSSSSNNIDITTDRNLYLVAGESGARDEPRVVTGVERVIDPPPASQIINEQREIELDGENLEDQQQLQQPPPPPPATVSTVASRNEPPLEGAVANSIALAPTTVVMPTHPIDTSHKQGSAKDHSNISTGNDESEPIHEQHRYTSKSTRNRHEASTLEKKLTEKQRKEKQHSVDRYASDDSEDEYPSEHERERRRRDYREGSARSDRGGIERDLKEKKNRRELRGDYIGADRERDREKHHNHHRAGEGGERSEGFGGKSERRSQRYHRYEADSKYETEESTRHEAVSRKERRSGRNERERGERDRDRDRDRDRVEERSGRSDRSDRDYDDYRRYHHGNNKREGKRGDDRDERRDRRDVYAEDERRRRAMGGGGGGGGRRGDKDYRAEYENTLERRSNRRSDKHRVGAAVDPSEYEEYRKQSSRNARESDLDKDRRNATRGGFDARHAGMYAGYPSTAYGYDPYTYYYEQMARTNPQAYAEWYKKYYGHAAAATMHGHDQLQAGSAAATDGRESVHSGRSSANNENDRSGNLSLRETTEPQRLTPCKFVNDHAVVSFSAGLLITVKPKYTPHGVSNIVKLLRLGPNDSTRQLFQAFPGPLVRGLTHKKTVIEFCEEQIQLGPQNTTIYAKQLLSSNMEKFKASYTLMWNLLILLLRQNGMVVGTDIAELLLKNQVQFPYNPQSNTPNSTASNSLKTGPKSESDSIEDADMKDSDIECDVIEPAAPPAVKSSITVTEDNVQNGDDSIASVSKSNTASTSCSSEEEITAKFRNFLLYGNVNEALDWATDNNLWGHALFLASKVDRRSHANVMMKFANKLSLNDPLQTLYQLMSGRTPSSVTSVQDEKWGDWRPHLSMILSNTSQKPELDRKAITTLGDSLFNRGDLYAAHFCYLMAQVSFGRYQDSATQETALQQSLPKLVLLGSSHYKFFKDFASNDAIIMTEIYEYACSLNDEKFSLVEFQPYKYLLATRMLDYGYQLKSLMYLEQISLHIERDPSKYEPSFINKVYEFADRLKFYDPVLEKSMDDPQNVEGNFNSAAPNFEEQKWLQNLRSLAVQYKPDYGYIATAPSNTNAIDENLQLDYQKQFAEINKQFSELNMQYNSNNIGVATEGIGYNTNSLQQQTVPQSDNIDMYTQQQQQQQLSEQQQQQHLQQQSVMTNNTDYSNLYGQPTVYGSETLGQSQDVAADNYAAAAYGQQPQFYDPNQQQQQQQQQQTEFNASSDVQQNNASYDYWAGQQLSQQLPGNEENARPTISMPNSKKSYDSDVGDEQKPPKQEQENTNNSKKNKNDGKDGKSSQSASNQNSGWFGGIWNKLSLKPKNQMILPDDKNPTIVWDAEKKRWVNTDGGDDGGADAIKPPPKMGELMSQQQQQPPQQQPMQPQQQQQQMPMPQQQQQMPTAPIQFEQLNQYGVNPAQQQQQQSQQQQQQQLPAGIVNPIQTYSAIGATTAPATSVANTAEPTKPPSLQSNMFKMQRNRTLKNSYVDVFNPSGAPMSKAAENVLAPALPPAAVPQGGFFIPGAPPNASNDAAGAYQQEQPAQDLPQFYNPNQFGAATGNSY